jgi:hypothetical protein
MKDCGRFSRGWAESLLHEEQTKGVDMTDLDRLDRVLSLLSQTLDLLAKYSQRTTEPTLEHEAFDRLVDARDEVRTLRARLVSGASGSTD